MSIGTNKYEDYNDDDENMIVSREMNEATEIDIEDIAEEITDIRSLATFSSRDKIRFENIELIRANRYLVDMNHKTELRSVDLQRAYMLFFSIEMNCKYFSHFNDSRLEDRGRASLFQHGASASFLAMNIVGSLMYKSYEGSDIVDLDNLEDVKERINSIAQNAYNDGWSSMNDSIFVREMNVLCDQTSLLYDNLISRAAPSSAPSSASTPDQVPAATPEAANTANQTPNRVPTGVNDLAAPRTGAARTTRTEPARTEPARTNDIQLQPQF